MNFAIAMKTAVMLFPILAGVMTVPFVLFQYRKYGSIPFMRVLTVYMFVFYLLCVFALVTVPLPSSMDYHGASANLIPFSYVAEISEDIHFDVTSPVSWLSFVLNSRWLEVLFNILMTMPFGFMLRYYFQCSMKKTLLYSLLLSLFIELTQLTGLWFIYPRAYRCFDVNDLMGNTLGGVLGALPVPITMRILPSRTALDQKAYENGRIVTFNRRWIAFLLDSCFVFLFTGVLQVLFPKMSAVVVAVVVMTIIPYMFHGQTLGKSIVRMRLLDHGKGMYALRLFVRQSVVWGFLYGTVLCWNDPLFKYAEGVNWIFPLLFLGVLFDLYKSRKKDDKHLFYEEVCRIDNESTINNEGLSN